jgi:hypothetical protein
MKQAHEIGFPTIGEVLHFVYKATGVLSDKRDLTPGIDEKQRKAVQKTLERLAKEEGNIHDAIGEAIRQFAYLMTGYVRHRAFNFAIGEVVMDMLDVYKDVIKGQGTYLGRRETLRWMIEEHWVPAAALSIAKQILGFGLRVHATYFPGDEHWYLPHVQDGKLVWPLAKVMQWIYTSADISQTQFHYPDRKADETDTERERDLENVRHWAKGRHWPSAAGLDWTFRRGFSACNPDGAWTETHTEAACIALFVARSISYAGSTLCKEFGEEFLMRVCSKFEQTLTLVLQESGQVEQWLGELAQRYSVSPLHPDLRSDAVTQWGRELQQREKLAGREIQSLFDQGLLEDREIERLANIYGRLPVVLLVDQLRSSEQKIVPPEFVDALGNGMDLAKDRELDFESIDAYETSLKETKMDMVLPWMAPWLRFQLHYRQCDDANAWIWIQQAFDAGRYRAGGQQYKIVNHYVEMAAKRKNIRKFKAGVYWANYIGLDIRWLRDKEFTDENLQHAMSMLSLSRYPV